MGGVKDSPKLWCLRKGRLLSISERVKFVSSATYNCSQPFCMLRGQEEAFVKVFRTGQGAGVMKSLQVVLAVARLLRSSSPSATSARE